MNFVANKRETGWEAARIPCHSRWQILRTILSSTWGFWTRWTCKAILPELPCMFSCLIMCKVLWFLYINLWCLLLVNVVVVLFEFLPSRRYASAGNSDRNVSVCPSVCLSVRPSVRPSRAGIVSKRRKLAAWFLHHLVAPRLVFWRQILSPNSKGFPPNGGLK